jgi:CAP-Gly domain-containing linker protein 1
MSTSRTTATTPSLKARTTPKPLALQEKITAGSRAAKYANMTAKDLNSSKNVRQTPASPSPKTNRVVSGESPRNSRILANGSPRSSRIVSQGSPIRGPSSPFSTPRAMASSKFQVGYGKSRSGNTPRARAPSSASMPPPSSPFSAKSMRSSRDDEFDEVDSISRFQLPTSQPRSRPGSSASVRSDDAGLVDRLQSRLDALEYENERLRKAATALSPNEQGSNEDRVKELDELKSQKQEAFEKLARLEDDLKVEKSLTASQQTQLSSLSADAKSLRQELERVRTEDQATIDGLQSEKIELGAELEQLRRDLVDREIAQSDLQDNLHVKEADIEALQSNVALLAAELEEEKRELGGQIEELRTAGQVSVLLWCDCGGVARHIELGNHRSLRRTP